MRLSPRLFARPLSVSAVASSDRTCPSPSTQSTRLGWALAFLVGPLFSVAFVGHLIGVDHTNFHTPHRYTGDTFSVTMWAYTLVETGWWTTNDRIGAPFRMEMHDYPTNPNLHFALMKALSLQIKNPFALVHAYYFLGVGLIVVTSLIVLRALGLRPLPALVVAVLFAVSPYVIYRGTAHLFLSTCFMIPLQTLVAVWVARGDELFRTSRPDGRRTWRPRGKGIAAAAIALASGFDFPYYPVFGCFFLAVAALRGSVRLGSWRPAVRAATLVGLTAAGFVANMWPHIAYVKKHGPNPSPQLTANRTWQAAEYYALRISAVLMPTPQHRSETLRELEQEFTRTSRLWGSEQMAVGMVAGLGFVGLLLVVVAAPRDGGLAGILATFTLAAVLLSTLGGVGCLVNYLTIGALRCYERIIVFVSFFALIAVALAADRLLATAARWSSAGVWLVRVGLVALAAVGLWDQTGSKYWPPRSVVDEVFASDRSFVRQIEAQLPPRAMVFNLPHQTFLDGTGPLTGRDEYSHFRYYLHSTSVRWSYGATCGRVPALLHERIAAQPTSKLVDDLCLLGFAGVTADREMLKPEGNWPGRVNLPAELEEILGPPTTASPDGRHVFFPLTLRRAVLEARHSPEKLHELRHQILTPVLIQWSTKFGGEEIRPDKYSRWCDREGRLHLINLGEETRPIRLRFEVYTIRSEPANFVVDSPQLGSLLTDVIDNAQPTTRQLDFTLPPKSTVVLRFWSDAAREFPMRPLSFRVENYSITGR